MRKSVGYSFHDLGCDHSPHCMVHCGAMLVRSFPNDQMTYRNYGTKQPILRVFYPHTSGSLSRASIFFMWVGLFCLGSFSAHAITGNEPKHCCICQIAFSCEFPILWSGLRRQLLHYTGKMNMSSALWRDRGRLKKQQSTVLEQHWCSVPQHLIALMYKLFYGQEVTVRIWKDKMVSYMQRYQTRVHFIPLTVQSVYRAYHMEICIQFRWKRHEN